MKRREFLATVGAVAVAPFVPLPSAARGLVFHPDTFALTTAPFAFPNRMDVLYGYAAMNPHYAVRITEWPEPRGSFATYLAEDAAIQAAL